MTAGSEVSLRTLVRELTGFDVPRNFKTDFETRLAFQKCLFLLQEAEAISESHAFNFYAHGPYSPDWARIGYAIAGGGDPKIAVAPDGLESVKSLIGERKNDSKWLTSLAVLRWYSKTGSKDADNAKYRAVRHGKFSVLANFDEAWKTLRAAGWVG